MGYQRKSCEVGYGRIDRIVSFLRWLGTMYSKPSIFMQVCVTVGKKLTFATVYKGNIIKNLIMDCQSYTKYRPNETTGGIFVSWRRKEELPTGA